MTLPHPWEAYLRLQSELDATNQVSNRSWGLEAGLGAILAVAPLAPANLPTAMATAERRERHRARLRRIYQPALRPMVDQPAVVEARVEIEKVRQLLHPADWKLISSVAMGMDYQDVGRDIGATPSSLRIRVMRIRTSRALAA